MPRPAGDNGRSAFIFPCAHESRKTKKIDIVSPGTIMVNIVNMVHGGSLWKG